jgi:selenocysteine-specific elongation factor
MTDSMMPFVLGTAGHIDHGKSTLVRALTGVDPDRLPEEKRRGMTIELGFAQLKLPSGRCGSIIDVPGHERLITTMVAGAGGIDAAILVVAANEGVMPQTREHVGILDLLGITRIVVAISKIDLVDSELVELVEDDTKRLLSERFAQVHCTRVSTSSGQGLSDLLDQIELMLDAGIERRPGITRLPVDRVFSVHGFGTVVTGTLLGNVLAVGDTVEIGPGGKSARVRGLQIHGQPVRTALPGSRVAINVSGRELSDIRRGDVLGSPGLLRTTRSCLAWVDLLASNDLELNSSLEVQLLAGTTDCVATVTSLNGGISRGDSGPVRIRLREPGVLWRGQHFILRMPEPLNTIGGGHVVSIDSRGAWPDAATRTQTDKAAILAATSRRPVSRQFLAATLNLASEELAAEIGVLTESGELFELGGRLTSLAGVERFRDLTLERLGQYHLRHPQRLSMPREELRQQVHLERDVFTDMLEEMARRGNVTLTGDGVATAEGAAALSDYNPRFERFVELLSSAGLSGLPVGDLLNACDLDPECLLTLRANGRVVKLTREHYIDAQTYERVLDEVEQLLERQGQATVSQIRDALGSSRRPVLSLLEHLDGAGITRRDGDLRVAGPRLRARSA